MIRINNASTFLSARYIANGRFGRWRYGSASCGFCAGGWGRTGCRCGSNSGTARAFDLGPTPKITLVLTTPTLQRSLVRGDIDALGDAYVAGTLRVEGRLGDIIGVGIALAQRAGQLAWLGQLLTPIAKLRRFTHSRAADAAAISHHYDVSNDFYALWLDRRMIYSCAYFVDRRRGHRRGARGEARPSLPQAPAPRRRSACSISDAAGAGSRSTPLGNTACGYSGLRSANSR